MCGNMKLILSVDKDISRVSKANELDILFNKREINFIFPSFQVFLCLFYKKLSYCRTEIGK